MTAEMAHLRFADDVFPVVEALQRHRPLQAKDAREVYEDAPPGWYVVTMQVQGAHDMYEIIAKVARETGNDGALLTCDLRWDGDGYCATFRNLRGFAQTVH